MGHIKAASSGIYEKMTGILNGDQILPDPASPLVEFGKNALSGYVYCMTPQDVVGLNPRKFLSETAEVIAPAHSLEEKLGTTIIRQLGSIDFTLPTAPDPTQLHKADKKIFQ